MTSLGLCSTSYVINLDHNWHHLLSTSTEGKDLNNNAQIRAIGSVEPEICTKMLKTLTEKLRAKFPKTSCGYSMVKITHLDAFSEFFNWKQKEKKRRKWKQEKNP